MSGDDTGQTYDLTEITNGAGEDASLPHGEALNAFCEAIVRRDMALIDKTRARLLDEIGEKAMVDAAATIAAFNAYPRAADATGLPLEEKKDEMTKDMRAALGLDSLSVHLRT
jgi:hypothetical protein